MFAIPVVRPAHDSPLHRSHLTPELTTASAHVDSLDGAGPAPPNSFNSRPGQARLAHFVNLSLLRASEDAIRRRKENIARFGSTWLKPPGVAKTLQAETEERAEREEQEVLARREQMMMDMQAQQEAEEARQRAAAAEVADEGTSGSRDLDDDVPEGMEVEDDEDEVEEDEYADDVDLDGAVPEAASDGVTEMESEIDGGITTGEVTFNDGSLLEGSMLAVGAGSGLTGQMQQQIAEQARYAAIEEAELTGVAQEQDELGMTANLDSSVPEAEAYEHTDTEMEDESSDNDEALGESSFSNGLPPRDPTSRRGLFDRPRGSRASRRSEGSGGSRGSLSNRDISSLLESSFMTSSPVVGRLRSANRGGRRPQ